MTMETVCGQTLALQLGDRDEHCTLEWDTTGLNVKGNLYLYLYVTYTQTLLNLSPSWEHGENESIKITTHSKIILHLPVLFALRFISLPEDARENGMSGVPWNVVTLFSSRVGGFDKFQVC